MMSNLSLPGGMNRIPLPGCRNILRHTRGPLRTRSHLHSSLVDLIIGINGSRRETLEAFWNSQYLCVTFCIDQECYKVLGVDLTISRYMTHIKRQLYSLCSLHMYIGSLLLTKKEQCRCNLSAFIGFKVRCDISVEEKPLKQVLR